MPFNLKCHQPNNDAKELVPSNKKFHAKSTALEVIEGHDLRNKDFIVTGASSGIGIETARALAKAGARVVIAARDLKKAEEVARDIRESTKNPLVEVEELKLDSLENVNAFVKRYLDKKRPLHCLINNAGVMACPKSYTVDGFETQFGTNHMGHFALTIGLLPALKEAYKQTGKKSRVVNVSSLAHFYSDVVFDDINFKNREYDGFKSYGQSKTANILFSIALTEKYSNEGIVSNALMPGGILTGLQKHMPREIIQKYFEEENTAVKSLLKSLEQGASTTIWAAVAPELEGVGGLYLEDCQISKVTTFEEITKEHHGYMEYVMNKENARKLWDISMNWLKNPPK